MVEEKIDSEQIRALKEKTRRENRKKEYNKKYFTVKLRTDNRDKLDKIQNYMSKDMQRTVSKADALEQLINFYEMTVIGKNLKESEALSKFFTNYGSYSKLSDIQEQIHVSNHIGLTVLQNIGLQGMDKDNPIPIESYIENLEKTNNSSDLNNYIKELYSKELHQKRLKRG